MKTTPNLDRPVAINLRPPERAAEPSLRGRFVREARLAAKLSHPNIIPIHAVAPRSVAWASSLPRAPWPRCSGPGRDS
jgi:serine/threonine protein kinase